MSIGHILSNTLHTNIRNSVFYKTFILFVSAAIIPAVCIGVLSMKHSSSNIIGHMEESIGALLDDRSRTIDQQFHMADYASIQIVSSDEIRKLISNNDLSGSFRYGISNIRRFDYYKLINSMVISNTPLIESIYLFGESCDFVLSRSKFSKSDFFDQDILEMSFTEYVTITNPRTVIEETNAVKNVISYVRRFDIFPSMESMYVVVNINYDKLFSGLAMPNMKYPYEFFVLDGELSTVFRNSAIDIDLNDIDIEEIYHRTGSSIQNIGGIDYYIQGRKLATKDYTLIFIQRYADIVQSYRPSLTR